MPISEVYLGDCMNYMKTIENKFFDLAVVDPPYGIEVNMNAGKRKGEKDRYKNKKWDNEIPDEKYFEELKRISKNQIIWGCNYYNKHLYSSGRISWYKNNGANNDYSDCELAMHTFNNRVTNVSIQWSGFIKPKSEIGKKRIHPTQKPIALYSWILKNYAKQGDKIFDSHTGSQSSRIAAYKMGFDYWGCEKDEDYFKEGCERFDKECKGILVQKDGIKIIQNKLF